MKLFQMELINGSDKKKCQVCEKINGPLGKYRVKIEFVCPDCRTTYVFIQVSGIDLGEGWKNFKKRMEQKKMNLAKEK